MGRTLVQKYAIRRDPIKRAYLAQSGVDLCTVGKLLGHENVPSTARNAHLANDTLMAATDAGAAKLNDNG